LAFIIRIYHDARCSECQMCVIKLETLIYMKVCAWSITLQSGDCKWLVWSFFNPYMPEWNAHNGL